MSTISGLHPDNAHTSKFPHRVCNRILDWPCVLYFLPLRYFPIVTIGTPISSIALLTVGIWFAGERYTWDTTSASQSDSTMLRIKFLYRVTDVTPVLHEVTGGMHPTGFQQIVDGCLYECRLSYGKWGQNQNGQVYIPLPYPCFSRSSPSC